MENDNIFGNSGSNVLAFDPNRIKEWGIGTVVVSIHRTRSSSQGEAGVIVQKLMPISREGKDTPIRYAILFAGMGFDHWTHEEIARSLQIIPNPRASLLHDYNFVSLPKLEHDIAYGGLKRLFGQVNRVADEFFEVDYSDNLLSDEFETT